MSIFSILKKFLKKEILFFATLLICSLVAFKETCNAQKPTTREIRQELRETDRDGAVRGRVASADGKLLEGVEVILISARCDCSSCDCPPPRRKCCCCPRAYGVKTNEFGGYEFDDVPPGDYKILLNVDGKDIEKEVEVKARKSVSSDFLSDRDKLNRSDRDKDDRPDRDKENRSLDRDQENRKNDKP